MGAMMFAKSGSALAEEAGSFRLEPHSIPDRPGSRTSNPADFKKWSETNAGTEKRRSAGQQQRPKTRSVQRSGSSSPACRLGSGASRTGQASCRMDEDDPRDGLLGDLRRARALEAPLSMTSGRGAGGFEPSVHHTAYRRPSCVCTENENQRRGIGLGGGKDLSKPLIGKSS